MKIIVYAGGQADAELLRQLEIKLKETEPGFSWQVTTLLTEFYASVGSYKIFCHQSDLPAQQVDLAWPAPSEFMKPANKAMKLRVWNDIQEKVFQAFKQPSQKLRQLEISESEMQSLLKSVHSATAKFRLKTKEGETIGINLTEGADTYLSSADLASILAAVWIFGAQGVSLAS